MQDNMLAKVKSQKELWNKRLKAQNDKLDKEEKRQAELGM